MNPSGLEVRLGRIDLQLDGGGAHLGDERIAELSAGADPRASEAAHLAACDACVELLIVLGEGLETLAIDEPILGALMAEAPRPSSPPGRRWTPLMLVALAGVAAAAGWWAHDAPSAPAPLPAAPTPAPPVDVLEGPDEVPILPADQVIRGRLKPAPDDSARPPPARGPDPTPRARVIDPAPAAARPSDTRPVRRAARPDSPQRPRGVERPAGLGTLERPSGPRPLERKPVDGPPRGFGFLQLNTRPSAQVFIDDKPYGWTPIIDLRLLEGPHDVRLVFESPLAAEPEQRFRVLIEPDRIWRMTRDNVKRTP